MCLFYFSTILLLFSVIATFLVYKKGLRSFSSTTPQWAKKLYDISSNHTQVSGILSGFTITVVVLIAGGRLSSSVDDREIFKSLETLTLGLFSTSFFGYVATGILFSLVIEHENDGQFLIFSVASIIYFFSVVLSFNALLELLVFLKYNDLFFLGKIMLLGTILGGYLAVCIPLLKLFKIRGRFLLLILVNAICFAFTLFLFKTFIPFVQKEVFITKVLLPWVSIIISGIFGLSMFSFFLAKKNKPVVYKNYLFILMLSSLFVITTILVYLTILIWEIPPETLILSSAELPVPVDKLP